MWRVKGESFGCILNTTQSTYKTWIQTWILRLNPGLIHTYNRQFFRVFHSFKSAPIFQFSRFIFIFVLRFQNFRFEVSHCAISKHDVQQARCACSVGSSETKAAAGENHKKFTTWFWSHVWTKWAATHTHSHRYIHTNTNTHTHAHTHTHTHTHTNMHAHTERERLFLLHNHTDLWGGIAL